MAKNSVGIMGRMVAFMMLIAFVVQADHSYCSGQDKSTLRHASWPEKGKFIRNLSFSGKFKKETSPETFNFISVKEDVDPNTNNLSNEQNASSSDPWDIRKKLTITDVKAGNLRISFNLLNEKILPKMSPQQQRTLNTSRKMLIHVFDVDRQKIFGMKLTRFGAEYYTLSSQWTSAFVRPRNLKVNDQIGLRWIDNQMQFTKFVFKPKECHLYI